LRAWPSASSASSRFWNPARAAEYDVVIYGGTSAGVIAAVQAKKMGKSAIIVCPDKHLGGLSSGGLGWTDTGNKAVIGRLSREFYHRIVGGPWHVIAEALIPFRSPALCGAERGRFDSFCISRTDFGMSCPVNEK
jgi:hypothetical protein